MPRPLPPPIPRAAVPYICLLCVAAPLTLAGVLQGGTQGWSLAGVMTAIDLILVGLIWLACTDPRTRR